MDAVGLLMTVGARLGIAVGLLVPVQAIIVRKSINNAQTKRFDILGFIFSPLAIWILNILIVSICLEEGNGSKVMVISVGSS